MNLVQLATSRLKKWLRSLGLNDSGIFKIFFPGNSTVNYSETTVLGISGVTRCLELLGWNLARIDKQVLIKSAKGFIPSDDDDLLMLLEYPSDRYSAFTFYETMTAFLALYENAYAWIRRDSRNKPVELIMIHPQDVYVNVVNGDFFYTVLSSHNDGLGYNMVVDPQDMIHLVGIAMSSSGTHGAGNIPNAPGLIGKSKLYKHSDTFRLGLQTTNYSTNFYDNGAHLSGYLYTPEHLSKKEQQEIKEEFSDYEGIRNVNSTPVLHSGLEYRTNKLPPRDALVVELANKTIGDISRIFGIPLHLLSELGRSTFSNIEMQSFEFVNYTIFPYAAKWENELQRKLVSRGQRLRKKIRFNTRILTAGDSDSRASYYSKMYQVGALSPDDIRGLEGFNPRADGKGDIYYTPVNMFSEEERLVRLNKNMAEIELLDAQAEQLDSQENIDNNDDPNQKPGAAPDSQE